MTDQELRYCSALRDQIAALHAENAEKDKRIARAEAERDAAVAFIQHIDREYGQLHCRCWFRALARRTGGGVRDA